MIAIRSKFDGKKIVVPKELRGKPATEVIVLFDEGAEDEERELWQRAQCETMKKIWDNADDAIFDNL